MMAGHADWSRFDHDASEMEKLLMLMRTPDTKVVKQAEENITKAMKDKFCVPVLLKVLRFSGHVSARQLAAVLLRLRIDRFWVKLDRQDRETGKLLVLDALRNEVERPVSMSTTYVVSAISKQELELEDAGNWDELLQFLQAFAGSPNTQQQELAMRLFYALTETVGTVFQPYFNDLKNLYSNVLQHSTDTNVRIAALKAASALIHFLSTGEDVLIFRDLVPLLLEGLRANLTGDVALAEQVLDILGELAESPAPILNKYIRLTVEVLVFGLQSPQVDEGIKVNVCEVLKLVIIHKSRFLTKAKLVPVIFQAVMQCLVYDFTFFAKFIKQHELPQEQQQEHDDEEDDDNPNLSQPLIAAMAECLPSRHTFNLFVETAVQQIESHGNVSGVPSEWIGLEILMHAASGLSEELTQPEVIGELTGRILQLAREGRDPIIRCTALMCLTEWVECLAPEIWKFMPSMLPVAIGLLRDPHNSIKTLSCDLIEFVADDVEEDVILPYGEELVANLLNLSQNGVNVHVQATAISSLSSVMVTFGAKYMPYFDQTCAVICPLATVHDEKRLRIRANAVACLGNVALTCSRKDEGTGQNNLHRFRPIMRDVLSNAMQGLQLKDFELSGATFAMFSSICDAFGEEIGEIVDPMIQALLEGVYEDDGTEVKVEDHDGAVVPKALREKFGADLDEDDEETEDRFQPGVRVVTTVGMDAIESKRAALEGIQRVFDNAPAQSLQKHIESCLEAAQAFMMNDHEHESIRAEAATTARVAFLAAFRLHPYPPLEPSMQELGKKWAESCVVELDLNKTWIPGMRQPLQTELADTLHEHLIPSWLHLIQNERSKVVVNSCLASVEKIAAHLGPSFLKDEEMLKGIVSECLVIVQGRGICQGFSGFDDDEEDEYEDDEEEDQGSEAVDLFDSACDLIGMLAKACGQTFTPLLEEIISNLVNSLKNANAVTSKRHSTVVGTLAEIFQTVGPNSAQPFVKGVLPMACDYILSNDNKESLLIKRNAAFLVGMLILFGGKTIQNDRDAVIHVLKTLDSILNDLPLLDQIAANPNAGAFELTDMQACIDNGCGAFGRIILSGSSVVPLDQVVPKLLRCLPLRFDFSENYCVVRSLNALLHGNVPSATANIEQIVGIFLSVMQHIEEMDDENKLHHTLTKLEIQTTFAHLVNQLNNGNLVNEMKKFL